MKNQNNNLIKSNSQTLTASLTSISTPFSLTSEDKTKITFDLIAITPQSALMATKVNQLDKKESTKNVFALLSLFSDAVKTNKGLEMHEIILLADWVTTKYTHDSIEDIALALKEGIFGGHKFYGSVTIADVKEVFEKYFEKKAEWLEKQHREIKNTDKDVSNTIISDISSGYTKANIESFTEQFERAKREEAKRNIEAWRKKMATPGLITDEKYFETIEFEEV